MNRVLGYSWMLLGGGLFVHLTVHFIQVANRSNHDIAWWTIQLLFPLFCLGACYFGWGALKKDTKSLKIIKVLSIIAMIYFAAFSLMGAHLWIALMVGLFALLFFCASLYSAIALTKQQAESVS